MSRTQPKAGLASTPILSADPTSAEGAPSIWAGFYKKTILERQDQIKLVFPQLNPTQQLPEGVADNMIENCIGTYDLPLGLGLNFVINDQPYVVPMATEEPSVIAAVSGAAKTIAQAGGFKATSTSNVMLSQVQILDVDEPLSAARAILDNKIELLAYGNTFCTSMVKRGGGVVDIRPRIVNYSRAKYSDVVDKDEWAEKYNKIDLDELVTKFDKSRVYPNGQLDTTGVDNDSTADSAMLIVHILIDVCESMGANLVTTVAEGLAPKLVELCGSGRAVVRIVSNLCEERRARASFFVPVTLLKYKGLDGLNVAKGILEAYALACEDQYRAATHNKGIMNGIDAAALALGQDWRAIEAGAHAWAARQGKYQPLTQYKLVKEKSTGKLFLFGALEMPAAVGVRGGAIQAHPVMSYTHGLVGTPTSRQLGEILACVGLAQNFAAIRAIVSEGIQRGHMSLHSRNIAIGAGAPPHLVQEISNYMISRGRIDHDTAVDYLRAHSILASSTQYRFKAQRQSSPSTLFVELDLHGVKTNLNIVFETTGTSEPVHLSIREDTPDAPAIPPIQKELFGEKSAAWFIRTFDMLENIRIIAKAEQKTNLQNQAKMKVLSIILNIIIYKLVKLHPDQTQEFMEKILAAELNPLSKIGEEQPATIRVGFSLILALWQVFKHQVEACVTVNALANALKEEQLRVFSALFRSPDVMKSSKTLERFMMTHTKRWQSTMFLLCDMQSLPATAIDADRLFLVFKLGSFYEWASAVAHDVARSERDAKENAPNVYIWWLINKQETHSQNNMQVFLREIDQILQNKRRKLLETKSDLFDVRLFLKAEKILQDYYGIKRTVQRAKL